MTAPPLPTLSAVTVEPRRVTLQGTAPDAMPYRRELPRPVTFTRRAQLTGPYVLAAYTLPPLASRCS